MRASSAARPLATHREPERHQHEHHRQHRRPVAAGWTDEAALDRRAHLDPQLVDRSGVREARLDAIDRIERHGQGGRCRGSRRVGRVAAVDERAVLVDDAKVQRDVAPALPEQRPDLPLVQRFEQAGTNRGGLDDEPEYREVLEAARVVPEEAQEDLAPAGSDAVAGDVDVLARRVLASQFQDGASQRRIAGEGVGGSGPVGRDRGAAAREEQGLAGCLEVGLRAPHEEPFDVGVGGKTVGELARHQLEAAGLELRMIHGGERVEHRALERMPGLDDDVVGGLLRDLPQDDRRLRVESRERSMLVVEDQAGGTERGRDGKDHCARTANRRRYPIGGDLTPGLIVASSTASTADGIRQTADVRTPAKFRAPVPGSGAALTCRLPVAGCRLPYHRPMWRAPVIVAVLLAGAEMPAATAQDLPRGTLIDEVKCLGDATQSYALYLPSAYTPDRAWSVLMAFHPSARGPAMVDKYRAAAEQYGYIVAGSNTSRNGPWPVSAAAVQAMSSDLGRRFSIDAERIYLTGMSGGARVAMQVALGSNTIAGVIASSAGFPDSQPRRSVPFAVYGTAGTDDFNYVEMRMLDRALTSPHRLAIFSGGHTLPTDAVALEAIEWMELQAMKSGRRSRDDELARSADHQAAAVDRRCRTPRRTRFACSSGSWPTSRAFVTCRRKQQGRRRCRSRQTSRRLSRENGATTTPKSGTLSEIFDWEGQLANPDTRFSAFGRLKGRLSQWARQAESATESAERSRGRRLLGAVLSGAGGRVSDVEYRKLIEQYRRVP